MRRYILFLMLVAYPIFSDISVILNTDENNYTLDDTISVELIIKADSSVTVSGYPEAENLVLSGRPSSTTMQSVQIINGKQTSSYTTTYRLNYLPEKEGWATLKPVYVLYKGKKYVSNSLKFKIKKDSNKEDSSTNFEYPFDKEIFITAQLDKTNIYVGEQFKITYSIYHRISVDFVERPTTPNYKHFWIEDLSNGIKNSRSRRKVYNGYYFNVTPFFKVALFGSKAGTFILPELKTKFRSSILSFSGSNRTYRRKSNKIEVKILPLPEKGKPKDFNSGNVGDYEFSFSLSKKKVSVNEPLTIKMTVEGKGNINNVVLPDLSGLKSSFKLYEPIEKQEVSNDGYYVRGKKTVTIALKGLIPGKHKLKGLKFSFFDTQTKKYKTIDYSDIEIEVTGKASKNINSNGETIQTDNKIGVSIKPLKESINLTRKDNKQLIMILFFLLILFPLIYIIIAIIQHSKNQYIENYTDLLSKKAFKKANNRIKNIDTNSSVKTLYSEFYSILVDYLEEKFSISVAGLTIDQISIFLEKKGVKKDTINKIAKELENSEFIKYSNMNITTLEKNNSLESINDILSRVERGE